MFIIEGDEIMAKKFKLKKVVATALTGAVILGSGTAVGAALNKRNNENKHPKEREYTVQAGDTLYDISNRFYGTGIYFDDLAEYNDTEDKDHIMPGDVIKIPEIESEELQPNTIQTYTVQSGDNLTTICKRIYNDGSYEIAAKLAKFNDIENMDLIKPGQKIQLPMYEDLQD